jgi:hypothetical protein
VRDRAALCWCALLSFVARVCLRPRKNQRPSADERAGWASGVTIALGNQAITSGERVKFADHIKQSFA